MIETSRYKLWYCSTTNTTVLVVEQCELSYHLSCLPKYIYYLGLEFDSNVPLRIFFLKNLLSFKIIDALHANKVTTRNEELLNNSLQVSFYLNCNIDWQQMGTVAARMKTCRRKKQETLYCFSHSDNFLFHATPTGWNPQSCLQNRLTPFIIPLFLKTNKKNSKFELTNVKCNLHVQWFVQTLKMEEKTVKYFTAMYIHRLFGDSNYDPLHYGKWWVIINSETYLSIGVHIISWLLSTIVFGLYIVRKLGRILCFSV